MPQLTDGFFLAAETRHVCCSRQAYLRQDLQPLQLWAELLRTAVLALQRRGESDGVAVFLYQLLAMDTAASEWQDVLQMA